MRALVVYESMYGNTATVALAIADGIRPTMPVEALEVGAAPADLPEDVALLVVGAPTHIHGMSTPRSRASAATRADAPLVSQGPGMREWLEALHPGTDVRGAAFDTRNKGPMMLTGSAAKSAAKLLRKAGLRVVEEPASFVLDGATGPVVDRVAPVDLDAARTWGARVASEATRHA